MEAGVDEVGRGCLSGPVFAAAVILPEEFKHPLIKDSKKLSYKKRKEAFAVIKENAISIGVSMIMPAEIDRINILQATFMAMFGAIDDMAEIPFKLMIDGDRFPGYKGISHECIIKGDSKVLSIAAASIIAKVTRDEYMEQLALEFPQYAWEKNYGYGTAEHMEAIEKYGLTKWHRKSLCSRFLVNNLFFKKSI
jgi:ribonuclease HII